MTSNGDAVILHTGTITGLANYPRGRLTPTAPHRTLFISGTSSRRPDGTFAGARNFSSAHEEAEKLENDLSHGFDVQEQTAAILRNIEEVIKNATKGKGGLGNLIDATVFLVNMRRDYAGMNAVWNGVWPRFDEAPARTTIGVKELPSPEMIIEIKCTAIVDL